MAEREQYYRGLDATFSRASSIYDSKILSNFVNVGIRNVEVATVLSVAGGAVRLLEVGCGTGEEASRIARRLQRPILGIDVAHGMVELATRKMAARGLSSLFQGTVLRASNIGSLEGPFDVVYSFNGSLNTEPDLEGFFDGLLRVTRPGAFIVISLRNRYCLGEDLLYRILGRREELARRRGGRVEVEVVGEKVDSTYYAVGEFLRVVPSSLVVRRVRALALLLPPYLAGRVRNPRVQALLARVDASLGRLPGLRTMGDETLFVLERT